MTDELVFASDRRSSRAMSSLREIAQALHRMDHGTYGVCMECEEPISAKRLDAVP